MMVEHLEKSRAVTKDFRKRGQILPDSGEVAASSKLVNCVVLVNN